MSYSPECPDCGHRTFLDGKDAIVWCDECVAERNSEIERLTIERDMLRNANADLAETVERLRALFDQVYKSEKRLGKEIEKLVDEIVKLKKERVSLRDDLRIITKQRNHYMWNEWGEE